mgnify:CR=1 FL=1
MFKFFNANKAQSTADVAKQSNAHENDAKQAPEEKKKVHGEDGVCCGSCGGE